MKRFLIAACLTLFLATPCWADRAQYVPDIVVTEPGAVWTDSRAYASLTAAIAVIDTNSDGVAEVPSTLVVSDTVLMGADVTIPSGCTLKVMQNGKIDLHTYDLTIKGNIEAGPYQIFDDSEATAEVINDAAKVAVAYAEWWGADSSDTTDDTAAVQSAIDFMQAKYTTSKFNSGKVQLLGGTYTIAGTLDIDAAVIIQGSGRSLINSGDSNGTVLRSTESTDTPLITVTADDVDTVTTTSDDQWFSLRDLNLYTTETKTSTGIAISSPNSNNNMLMLQINDVNIWGPFWNGIRSVKTSTATAARVFAKNMFINGCVDDGVYLIYGDLTTFENVSITKCGGNGWWSDSLAIRLVNCETFQNGEWGISARDVQIIGGYFNNDYLGEIYIRNVSYSTYSTLRHGSIVGAVIEYGGEFFPIETAIGAEDNPTSPGIKVGSSGGVDATAASGSLLISNCFIYGCNGRGIEIYKGTLTAGGSSSPTVLISNTTITGNGVSNSSIFPTTTYEDYAYSIYADGASVNLINSYISTYGIYLDTTLATITDNIIRSGTNTNPALEVLGEANVTIANNKIISDVASMTAGIYIDADAASSGTYGPYLTITGNNFSGSMVKNVSEAGTDINENRLIGNMTIINRDTSEGILSMSTTDTAIAAAEKLGAIEFKAPYEADGGDAILPAASVYAVAEGAFGATSNATSLAFATGSSEAATAKVKITSAGNTGFGTDGLTGTLGRVIINGSTTDGSTNILVGKDSGGTNQFLLDTNGNITSVGNMTLSAGDLIITDSDSPAASDACVAGTITWDASYLYVCTASGVWKRTAALTGGY